jgi:hypothetical protein
MEQSEHRTWCLTILPQIQIEAQWLFSSKIQTALFEHFEYHKIIEYKDSIFIILAIIKCQNQQS